STARPLPGWYYLPPLVQLWQGMVNAPRLPASTPDTQNPLPDTLATSGKSLLSTNMQLSRSNADTIAGMLLASVSG
ncbi:hypothetical protein V8G55_24715, partial [Salmonella enterica subsp. enterica serovar Kentucky]